MNFWERLAQVMGTNSEEVEAPPPCNGTQCTHHTQKRRHTGMDLVTGLPMVGDEMLRWMETHMVLRPDYLMPGMTRREKMEPPPGFVEMPLRYQDGRQCYGWYAPPSKKDFPVLAYVHGNSSDLDMRIPIIEEMKKAGFGVYIVALPGFRGSDFDSHGKRQHPSEQAFINTVRDMVYVLNKGQGVPLDKIILFGESMGGALSICAAKQLEAGSKDLPALKIGGIISYATFTSFPERVKEEYRFLHPEEYMQIRLDARKAIPKVSIPIFLMHGDQDEITCMHHSEELKKAGGPNVQKIILPGVNHKMTKMQTITGNGNGKRQLQRQLEQTDPEQVKMLVEYIQDALHELKVCPECSPLDDKGREWREKIATANGNGTGNGAHHHR